MLHSILQPNFPFCVPLSLLSAIKTIEVLMAAASDKRKKENEKKKSVLKWIKSLNLLLLAALLTLAVPFMFRSCPSDQHAPGHLRSTETARHHPLPGRRQSTSDISEMGERWLSSQSGEGQAFMQLCRVKENVESVEGMHLVPSLTSCHFHV